MDTTTTDAAATQPPEQLSDSTSNAEMNTPMIAVVAVVAIAGVVVGGYYGYQLITKKKAQASNEATGVSNS